MKTMLKKKTGHVFIRPMGGFIEINELITHLTKAASEGATHIKPKIVLGTTIELVSVATIT